MYKTAPMPTTIESYACTWRDGSECIMHSCVAAADVASFSERAECELVCECVCACMNE